MTTAHWLRGGFLQIPVIKGHITPEVQPLVGHQDNNPIIEASGWSTRVGGYPPGEEGGPQVSFRCGEVGKTQAIRLIASGAVPRTSWIKWNAGTEGY